MDEFSNFLVDALGKIVPTEKIMAHSRPTVIALEDPSCFSRHLIFFPKLDILVSIFYASTPYNFKLSYQARNYLQVILIESCNKILLLLCCTKIC
jgi:hypothetical protein